jgi:hypothetical protein
VDDRTLTALQTLASDEAVARALSPVIARVERALAAGPDEPQAWEPVPLETFGVALPDEVESCWIFLLRSRGRFGAERHPNSHQRSIALRGSAAFELREGAEWVRHTVAAPESRAAAPESRVGAAGVTGERVGVSGTRGGVPGERAISIPAGTWHRIEIGPEDFLSLSFHTVPAGELIEETPVGDDLSVTRKRLYHG